MEKLEANPRKLTRVAAVIGNDDILNPEFPETLDHSSFSPKLPSPSSQTSFSDV